MHRVVRKVANGGELLVVEQPGEIVDFVPHMSLTRLERVELENLTASKPGRAVRLFPDGTFDGYVQLVPGENRLRVTVYGEGGGVRELEHVGSGDLVVRWRRNIGRITRLVWSPEDDRLVAGSTGWHGP